MKNPFIQDNVNFELNVLHCGEYELACYIFEKNIQRPCLFIKDAETGLYHVGGDFCSYDWNATEIRDDVLAVIEEVMDRKWGSEVMVNNITTMCAVVYPEITYFTSDNDLTRGINAAKESKNSYLATSIFREIVSKWLSFLENYDLL